jgi:hypothetical protein
LEVQLWGGLVGTSDTNHGISSITNANSTNFFGSSPGLDFRKYQSTIYWSQTATSNQTVQENASTEASFNSIWNSISVRESSNAIWQALDQANLVTSS